MSEEKEQLMKKYSNKLVLWFAVITSLLLLALLVARQIIVVPIWIVLAACLTSFVLLYLMIYALQIKSSEASDGTNDIDKVEYILSSWNIETFKAAGVPRDITKCLCYIKTKFEASSPPKSLIIKNWDDKKPDNWLIELKENLGETRVEEYKEVILRYTRRKIKQSAPRNSPSGNIPSSDSNGNNGRVEDKLLKSPAQVI